jgi:polyhydroxybutyrate depolymerase
MTPAICAVWIEEISQQFAVDRKRISLFGNSGGAFMAHRMACQFADLIAGIASRAGATFLIPAAANIPSR